MKNLKFVAGFLLASCLFLLINATTHSEQTEGVPRYHVLQGYTRPIVYDAVTGKKVSTTAKVLENDAVTLKQILEQETK